MTAAVNDQAGEPLIVVPLRGIPNILPGNDVAATVIEAAAHGWAEQQRPLANGNTEVVFACRPDRLVDALDSRLTWTGGIPRR